MTSRGILYLVVGASGAGKDTLISHAIRHRPDIVVMPRAVTRQAEARGNIEVTTEEFTLMRYRDEFSLSWDAHGLHYGVPKSIEEKLTSGQAVILNGSRSIVEEAREKFSPLRIIHITAPIDILTRRLYDRGREDDQSIDHRLGRSGRALPQGPDVITIDNSGSVEDGVAAFLEALA